MIRKDLPGVTPEYVESETEIETSLETFTKETITHVEDAMENMQFSVALSSLWLLISRTNTYIDETEPWILAKDDANQGRLGNVMAHLVESLRIVGVM